MRILTLKNKEYLALKSVIRRKISEYEWHFDRGHLSKEGKENLQLMKDILQKMQN